MPKPQGTYLHTRRVDKIAHSAHISKALYARSQAEAMHRADFHGLDLADARAIALEALAAGSEPTTRGGRARKKLAEVLEKLDDLREELEKLESTETGVGALRQELRATHPGAVDISCSNVVALAMVILTLAMVLERIVGGKRGASSNDRA